MASTGGGIEWSPASSPLTSSSRSPPDISPASLTTVLWLSAWEGDREEGGFLTRRFRSAFPGCFFAVVADPDLDAASGILLGGNAELTEEAPTVFPPSCVLLTTGGVKPGTPMTPEAILCCCKACWSSICWAAC